MFVNSGRAIVFMFSGMNKDVYVLGLGFSVYLFFYVYSCYGYDVAFQQFSYSVTLWPLGWVKSMFKLHKVWDQVQFNISLVQNITFSINRLQIGVPLLFCNAIRAQLINKLLANIELISFKNSKYLTS